MRGPVARPENAPSPQQSRVAWVLTSSGLLGTGLLVAATSLIRWWGTCLPSAVYTIACTARQTGDLATHDFPRVGDDLRAVAVLHGITGLVSALTWLGPAGTRAAGPGEGLVLAPSLVILSIVIIVLCWLDARRPGPPSPERPDYPDRPDLTLAA
jgi:hypothetical protein